MLYTSPESSILLPWFFFRKASLISVCQLTIKILVDKICYILADFLNSIFKFLAFIILKFTNGIPFSSL